MSERSFRLFLGSWLVAAEFFSLPQAILALALLTLAEGVSNWRIPRLVSALRGRSVPDCAVRTTAGIWAVPFEAERALRLIIASLLFVALGFPALLWWLPWFVGFALVGAGLSGMCPMVVALRWLGLQ
ncbi:MAG: hypothetical protein WCC36_14985 [Gammaproteobacteria bacterium]